MLSKRQLTLETLQNELKCGFKYKGIDYGNNLYKQLISKDK